jgi:hypothetical protein
VHQLHYVFYKLGSYDKQYGIKINTNEYVSVLDAQGAMPNAPTTPSNLGAILPFKEELTITQ